MQKNNKYRYTFFNADVVKKAIALLIRNKGDTRYRLSVGDESTRYDDEREYFSDYRKPHDSSNITISNEDRTKNIDIEYWNGRYTSVSVEAPTRGEIDEVLEVFESEKEASIETSPEPSQRIFIGHGRSDQWKDLKDHLVDKHNIAVEAYETGARAGHSIRDILEDMADNSTMAFLVMTAEDESEDGLRARQNVVHEVGLFQGRLGFSKAIVLLEKGTSNFSNMDGIQQIRYSEKNIKETFGEVLATIKRESES